VSPVGIPPVVVLDDDPTGVQTLAGIRVLLAWDPARIQAALAGRRAVHLVTNTRALQADRVQPLVEGAARAALEGVPTARIVLRGDSTLRGHLLEEYLGVRDVIAPTGWPVLLLVPALPSAGRVTVGGVHLFEREGVRTPLHETEYARDGVFAYGSARLLDWAEERSAGLFAAAAGRELPLEQLRDCGAAAVAEAVSELAARGVPAVFAPDAETVDDLEVIAAGYRVAVASGVAVIVRCAPTFAGVLAGTAATAPAPFPDAGDGVLVVCGSYVAQTTRQLGRLLGTWPRSLVEADVLALAGAAPDAEIERLAGDVSAGLRRDRVAVLATPRERPEGTAALEAGERIAVNLARVVAALDQRPSVLVVKGGITSAVTLGEGVGADEADVLGPVVPGVSLWETRWPDGRALAYLVVPGNVGDDGLLDGLVGAIVRESVAC
jgi:uncharacterized protein YgbK (DUF1537 family)